MDLLTAQKVLKSISFLKYRQYCILNKTIAEAFYQISKYIHDYNVFQTITVTNIKRRSFITTDNEMKKLLASISKMTPYEISKEITAGMIGSIIKIIFNKSQQEKIFYEWQKLINENQKKINLILN